MLLKSHIGNLFVRCVRRGRNLNQILTNMFIAATSDLLPMAIDRRRTVSFVIQHRSGTHRWQIWVSAERQSRD